MSERNKLFDQDGEMYITFGSYLEHLRGEEGLKPPSQRREVPTNRELAKAIRDRYDIKLHEVTLSNMINGNVLLFNMKTARMLLDEMWRRGFTPQLTDFIKYAPPNSFLGVDGSYHPSGDFLGVDGKYHPPSRTP